MDAGGAAHRGGWVRRVRRKMHIVLCMLAAAVESREIWVECAAYHSQASGQPECMNPPAQGTTGSPELRAAKQPHNLHCGVSHRRGQVQGRCNTCPCSTSPFMDFHKWTFIDFHGSLVLLTAEGRSGIGASSTYPYMDFHRWTFVDFHGLLVLHTAEGGCWVDAACTYPFIGIRESTFMDFHGPMVMQTAEGECRFGACFSSACTERGEGPACRKGFASVARMCWCKWGTGGPSSKLPFSSWYGLFTSEQHIMSRSLKQGAPPEGNT
eukprot:1138351-Pelagomonas_calceolata.AAC.3